MKNLKIKKLFAVAVAGILTVGLVACGSSNSDSAKSDTASGSDAASGSYRTLDEIKEDGTINIGVFSDKNPFGYVDENGEYQGYDVYFANRLAKDLGVKQVHVVANKIRDEKDEEFVKTHIPAEDLLGFIHYNTEIMDADRQGCSPYDFSKSATDEIRKIKATIDKIDDCNK